jgi:hypothetical protein
VGQTLVDLPRGDNVFRNNNTLSKNIYVYTTPRIRQGEEWGS